MDYQYGGTQQNTVKKNNETKTTTVVIDEDEQLAQQGTQGNQAVNHALHSGSGTPPAQPEIVSPNPWSSNLFGIDRSNMEYTHTQGTDYSIDGGIHGNYRTKQNTNTLYEAPENSIIPNEDIKHVHKNHIKEYEGSDISLTTSTTDRKEGQIQQGDATITHSNATNFATANSIAHAKGEGFSGGAGVSIDNKERITAERSEGNIDYRDQQEIRRGTEVDWSGSDKKIDRGISGNIGASTMSSTQQTLPTNSSGTKQVITKTVKDSADLDANLRRRTDLPQNEGESHESNNYGGVNLKGSHSEKVALSTVYDDGSKYTHDREGKVFGSVGAKETSTGRTSQSLDVGVGGELGWEFQNQNYDGVNQQTRLALSGDTSVEVDHKGTDVSDGWEVSSVNNAGVTTTHDRNWTEGDSVTRDQNHKVVVGSKLDHNFSTDETVATGKGQYVFTDATTTQVDPNKQTVDSVSHDVGGQVSSDWENNLTERTDWEGKASYAATFKKSEVENLGDTIQTTSQGHKLTTNTKISDDSISGGVGYENIRESNVESSDGNIQSNSVIDKANLSGARDISKDDEGKKTAKHKVGVGIGRTYRDKEVTQTEDGKVTRQNDTSYAGNVGYETSSKKVDFGMSRTNDVQITNADGSKTKEKVTDKFAVDSGGTVGLSRDTSSVANSNIEKISSDTKLTTDRGKVTTSVGVKSQKDEDGLREYGAEAKTSYTHFSQNIKHTPKPMVDKLTGLKVGDKDTDGKDEVRTLQKSLNKLGHDIVEDGVYGNDTLKAVNQLQAEHGMEQTSDGLITENLAFKLPSVGIFAKGGGYTAGYDVGKAEADASAKVKFTPDQIKVKGAAGAKVTLVGGNAKIDVPVFHWRMGGERIATGLTFGVNAAVLAEANGTVELDIDKGTDKMNAGVGGSLKGFAGAKGGVEVGADLRWMRSSSQTYGNVLQDFARSLPGKLDDYLVDKLPKELWPQLAAVLIGRGQSKVAYAKAGVEGSAGIGGEASFSGGMNNGMIEFSGSLNGTVGLGGGVKTDLGINPIDMGRLGGVMSMKGITWMSDQVEAVAKWIDEVIDELQRRFDAYLEEEKQQGGFSGMLSSGIDFIGDDLLNLW